MALDDDRKFKIYIKAEGQGNWYEVGNNGKNIVSDNYTTASAVDTDAGMRINTTTTFTANDGDEMCIISHNDSDGSSTVDANDSNHRILKLKYAKGIYSGEANYKLKLCKSDVINLGGHSNASSSSSTPWDFYELDTGAASFVPIGGPLEGDTVTEMNAHVSNKTSIDTIINILIGKNNMGWNVSILDDDFGMGGQGFTYLPQFDDTTPGSPYEENHTNALKYIQYSTSDGLKHAHQINLKTGEGANEKNGFTMLGWYKSWGYAFPKLVDPFNIVHKVWYYDGSTGDYEEISENDDPVNAGDWNGPSSSAGWGSYRAKTWNITTYGLSTGIWVECHEKISGFEATGGMANSTGSQKAPFVFLTYN